MGKKSRVKKTSSLKMQDVSKKLNVSEYDSLHEGRVFSRRKTGLWSTYSKILKFYSNKENEEQIGLVGEEV